MIIDLEKINGRIKVRKMKTSDIALHLGISRMSLYNKLNGKFEFKPSEIDKLSNLLGKDIFLK
jgi:predicted XRE-type DNA-binding protein